MQTTKQTARPRIVFYVSEKEREKLKKLAKQKGVSVSTLIRFIIKNYFEEENEKDS